MKKFALVLLAMLTLAMTGCKVEKSKVTVYVQDSLELPVANRAVIYADLATVIIGGLIPSPEEMISGETDVWNYAETNALGFVEIPISLAVSKIDYEFAVWDNGKKDWVTQIVKLERGVNKDIEFTVQN